MGDSRIMKNKTNNPNGQPKGVPNKINASLREKIASLIDNNWDKLQNDLDSLEPKDRLNFMDKLLSYTLPKLQSVALEGDLKQENEQTVIVFSIPDNGRGVDYKTLSDNQLRAIAAKGESGLVEEGVCQKSSVV
jgi:hypothetical protein